jgi:hypothetical protein
MIFLTLSHINNAYIATLIYFVAFFKYVNYTASTGILNVFLKKLKFFSNILYWLISVLEAQVSWMCMNYIFESYWVVNHTSED